MSYITCTVSQFYLPPTGWTIGYQLMTCFRSVCVCVRACVCVCLDSFIESIASDRLQWRHLCHSSLIQFENKKLSWCWQTCATRLEVSQDLKCTVFWDIRLQKCRDLENRVRGASRSLEVSPCDRAHMTSYRRSIVTMALSRVVSEIFNVEKCRDLELGVRSLKVIESVIIR